MRLPRPFYRLPLRFDVERLRSEIAQIPSDAWVPHPNGDAGNSAAHLISVDGGRNEEVNGAMRMTAHLERSPYLKQVLAGFGVVWSRSRLLRLAPGAHVPRHADIHYHWFFRVRLHVPILTRPEVKFTCGGEHVHMAAGEAWVFDNWRLHQVENPTDQERIHLVADTSGNAAFWELVARGERPGVEVQGRGYDAGWDAVPLTERAVPRPVMPPAELDLLLLDMRSELVVETDTPEQRARLARYHALLLGFGRDWRQLYALRGEEPEGRQEFANLRDSMREQSRLLADGIAMRTNRVAAHRLIEARVLRACVQANHDRNQL
jgi:hypothetical protein